MLTHVDLAISPARTPTEPGSNEEERPTHTGSLFSASKMVVKRIKVFRVSV
jgi:hypothetical protein